MRHSQVQQTVNTNTSMAYLTQCQPWLFVPSKGREPTQQNPKEQQQQIQLQQTCDMRTELRTTLILSAVMAVWNVLQLDLAEPQTFFSIHAADTSNALIVTHRLTLMKLPTAFVIKMNVFVLPEAAAKGATAARQRMFLIEALI